LFGVALREGRDHLEMKMAPRGTIKPYRGPVGGWGSARSVGQILFRERRPFIGPLTLLHQIKPAGFQCVSCSYAKPGDPHPLEFCENGAKATAWENHLAPLRA